MEKNTKDLVEVNNEKDLMAKDVLQMMMKLVIGLVLALLITIGAFISYAVYKDYQFTEFINSFEVETSETTIEADQDGQGTNIVNNGEMTDVPKGENSPQDSQN